MTLRQLFKISGVRIEVIGFQIAIAGRQRIQPVIGKNDALRIFEFGEDLRLKHPVPLYAIAL
jgi:hypothetical protein